MDAKQILQQLQVLFIALAATPLFLMGAAYFGGFTFADEAGTEHLQSTLMYIVLAFTLGSLAISHLFVPRLIAGIRSDKSLEVKLKEYMGFYIMRMAALEGASILAAVAYMLTLDMMFVWIFVAVWGFFMFARPTKFGAINDLHLVDREVMELG